MRVLSPAVYRAVRTTAVAASILCGYVPTASSGEGIVFGSVLLSVVPGDSSFIGGRKAAELEYILTISSAGRTAFTLPVIPGEERHFVQQQLDSGHYVIDNLKPDSMLFGRLTFPVGLKFEVKPGQTAYIGRIVLTLPERIRMGARFSYAVQDAQREAIEKLGKEYPAITSGAVKTLAAIDPGPNIVPGNTVALPTLQADTVRTITAMDGAEDAACGRRMIVNTEVIKRPTPEDPHAQERWTLDRCGVAVRYLVNFRASPKGGTDIAVNKEP